MIRVTVQARQLLHLGVRPDAGWLTDTHRFVPGSVLRGALAALWLAHNRPPRPDVSADPAFLRLFEGDVRFGPLYPADDALRPLSVFGCKYADDHDCATLAHDAAFDGPPPVRCPHCDSPVEASKGRIDGAAVVDHTRVQLDARGQAVDGRLFTRRALSSGTHLTGLIAADLTDGLGWLAEPGLMVRLGGRRSTSGLASLSAQSEPAPPPFTGYRPDNRRLVVRLTSPGVLVDHLGQPSMLPDVTELRRLLGVPVVVDAAFARPALVAGWHAASNLPKPRDVAVAAGSVFVLRFDGELPGPDGLELLWRTGVGLRRAEGNGWVDLRRWQPHVDERPRREEVPADPVEELFVEITAHGIGPTLVDDLRGWSQDNAARAPAAASQLTAVLAKRRYGRLGPDAREVAERAFGLPPDQAGRLAERISDWAVARTSTRGRSR